MIESRLNKVLITAVTVMVTFLTVGIAVSPVFAVETNQTIRVLLPDGVPPGAQGQIEVDVRSWRSDEIETLMLEVPVVTDPAPAVTFDPAVGTTITGRVGEPLDIPFTIADPGMNNLVVEYLLNGEVLTADPGGFTPLELNSTVNGVLPFVGVENDDGYGQDYMFGAAYYSFAMPLAGQITFDLFYENNGGYSGFDIAGVVYIYRNDGNLTGDDYVTSEFVGAGGVSAYLGSGEYILALAASGDELMVSLANEESYACDYICPQEDIAFELSVYAAQVTPIELGSTVNGALPFAGVESDGGYGEDYMFGGAYYSFSLPDDMYVGFDVFYENNGGYSGYDITGVVHIFRDDGDLTVDDYETSEFVGSGGGDVFLDQGDYIFVVVASENETLLENLINGEPYACEYICPQENILFELSVFAFYPT